MQLDDFIVLINTLVSPQAGPEQKLAATQQLTAFEQAPENWLVCGDLINLDDPQARFFGYKYLLRVLRERPALFGPEQYPQISSTVSEHLLIDQSNFLQQKLIQTAAQLVVLGHIPLVQLLDFAAENAQHQTVLKLLAHVFTLIGAQKPAVDGLSYRRLFQLKAEAKSLSIASIVDSIKALIASPDLTTVLNSITLFNSLTAFMAPMEPFQFLFGLVASADFTDPTVFADTTNVKILTQLAVGIRCSLESIEIIDQPVKMSKDTYGKLCHCIFVLLNCCVNVDDATLHTEFIQLFHALSGSKTFAVLLSAQMNEIGRTLQNHDLLATKTCQVVEQMIQYKLKNPDAMQKHFLSLYGFGFKLLVHRLESDQQELILQVLYEVLDTEREKSKKLFISLTHDSLEEILQSVLLTIQKPVEIVYFVNEFNQLDQQFLNDSAAVELYKQQIRIIQLLLKLNKKFISVFEVLLTDLLKSFTVEKLAHITYVFEAFQQINQSFPTRTVFALLNLIGMVNDEQCQALILQSLFFVCQKSPDLLKDQQLNFQIIQQCLQTAGQHDAQELAASAVQCAVQCISKVSSVQCTQNYETVIPTIFDLAQQLDVFNIQNLYGALARQFGENKAILEVLLQPVHGQFVEMFLQLSTVSEHQLHQVETVNSFNQVLSIYSAIADALTPQERPVFVNEQIIEYVTTLLHFYNKSELKEAQFLLKCCYKLLGLVPDKTRDQPVIDDQLKRLGGQFQSEKVSPHHLFFVQLFREAPSPDVELGVLLSLVRCQTAHQEIQVEVNETVYFLLEHFLADQAKLFLQVTNKQDFLSCFVTIGVNYQFQPAVFDKLYTEYRETVISLVFRRSGADFLRFALQSIKESCCKLQHLVADVTAMAARCLGVGEVCQILGAESEIIEAVAAGNELAAEDLARGM